MSSPSPPYLLITMGPTGAGKTKLVEQLKKDLKIPKRHKFNKLIIDDLVEKNTNYKERVRGILKEDNVKKCIEEKSSLPAEIYDKFKTAYFRARRTGCGGKGCDSVLNNNLDAALKNQESIIFETTGLSVPLWLIEKIRDTEVGYNIVIGVVMVNFNILKERILKRTLSQISQFDKNPRASAPRLPKIEANLVLQIKETVKTVLSSCSALSCYKPLEIYVYDNTDRMELLESKKYVPGGVNSINSLFNTGTKPSKKAMV